MFIKNKNILFVHIPKNAGNSIRESMQAYNECINLTAHAKISKLKQEANSNPITFAVIRNPWDRLVSSFHYIKGGGAKNVWDLKAQKKIKEYSTFESFIKGEGILKVKNDTHFVSQSWFIDEPLDYTISYENLSISYGEFISKNNLKVKPLRKINQSNHKHYRQYYDQEMIKIVRDAYKEDVENFKYEY